MPFLQRTASRRAVLAGLAAALAQPALVGASRASAPPSTIRVGSTAPGHLKFVLGQHLGSFGKEFARDGIGVDFTSFSGGGSPAVTALATGALDIAYTGCDPALRIAAANVGVRLVGLSSYVPSGGSSIIVIRNSPIRTIADLKGKRIAYLTGTVRNADLAKALKLAHLGIGDIQSFNMPFESSGPALLHGDIDAIVETPNTAQVLVDKGAAQVLVDGNDHPEWATPNLISVNGSFLADHPDLVRRWLAVDIALAHWADAHYEQTIDIFVADTKSSDAATRALYPKKLFYQDPRITDAALEALHGEAAFMSGAGLLNGTVNFDSWVDRDIVDRLEAAA